MRNRFAKPPCASARRDPGLDWAAVLVMQNAEERARVREELARLRWAVFEVEGGAGLLALLEQVPCTAAILDATLPDLDADECIADLQATYPSLHLFSPDGVPLSPTPARGRPWEELRHALRCAADAPRAAAMSGGAIVDVYSEPARPSPGAEAPSMSGVEPRLSAVQQRGENPAGPVDAARGSAAHGQTPHKDGDDRRTPCEHPSGAPAGASAATGPTTLAAPERAIAKGDRAASSEAHAANTRMMPELLGSSASLHEVRRRVSLVAGRTTPVLILGPTGTGKELVARALHRLSRRAAGPFLAINCAAIPEALVEAELFGHARGAYTGAVQARAGRLEAAAGGTLFLDEIGELPLAAQSKLLRFLEAGELQRVGETGVSHADVRVVAATHQKLGRMAAEGSFRLDLLHRLSVFLIETPPLAGRTEDIDLLIGRELQRLADEDAADSSVPVGKYLQPEARQRLHAHSWPGNVRELAHTLERAWILAGTQVEIDASCIDFGTALTA